MPIGKPRGDATTSLQSRLAFLQGKIPEATSSNGTLAQARAVFAGALSHGSILGPLAVGVQPESLTRCQTRPCRGCDCFAGALILLRFRPMRVAPLQFTRNNEQELLSRRPRWPIASTLSTRYGKLKVRCPSAS